MTDTPGPRRSDDEDTEYAVDPERDPDDEVVPGEPGVDPHTPPERLRPEMEPD